MGLATLLVARRLSPMSEHHPQLNAPVKPAFRVSTWI